MKYIVGFILGIVTYNILIRYHEVIEDKEKELMDIKKLFKFRKLVKE